MCHPLLLPIAVTQFLGLMTEESGLFGIMALQPGMSRGVALVPACLLGRGLWYRFNSLSKEARPAGRSETSRGGDLLENDCR